MSALPEVDVYGALPKAAALIEEGLAAGLHPGAQLCVWRGDEVVADAGFGEALPGVAMTPGTLTLWLSAGKPLVAVAVAQLVERHGVDLDDPVAEYLPEFAANGKGGITLRHVLTHTGGFRAARLRYPEQTWDEAVAAVCEARLEAGWTVGADAGYHPHTGWVVLGRVIEVVAEQPLSDYLRENLFKPLGMHDTWVGMPGDVYDGYHDAGRIAVMMDTKAHPPKPMEFDERAWVTGTRPGGNCYAPARDLARFYRMLLGGGELDGTRVLEPTTVDLFTARHREGAHDRTFRAVVDWGLGFILNSSRHDAVNAGPAPYGYGPHASDATFGHGGNQCAAAFADPAHGLAVVLGYTGMPGEPKHQERVNRTLAAVYEDLGLAEVIR